MFFKFKFLWFEHEESVRKQQDNWVVDWTPNGAAWVQALAGSIVLTVSRA